MQYNIDEDLEEKKYNDISLENFYFTSLIEYKKKLGSRGVS